jgi:hypothetical protein
MKKLWIATMIFATFTHWVIADVTPPKPTCSPSDIWDTSADQMSCTLKAGYEDAFHCGSISFKGFSWDSNSNSCNGPVPIPDCGPGYQVISGLCQSAQAKSPTSSNDNYVGDCFEVMVKLSTLRKANGAQDTDDFDDQHGDRLLVTGQDTANPDSLKVARVKKVGFLNGPPFFACKPTLNADPETVSANDLLSTGAIRTGWVYGGLVLPFKYHFDDKSFGASTSVGPYVGRRSSFGAASYTWALTAGLTPISVTGTDSNGNQQTTALTAYTYAAGLIFEISKSSTPFRGGLFFGKDVVSSTSAVPYAHNRKNWLAFQLGYDFTDH